MTPLLLAVALAVPSQTRFESRLIELVNIERAAVGVAPLIYDERLHDAAELWVKLCHGTLAHYLPVEDCWGKFVPDLDGDGWCNVPERQIVCGWPGSGSEAGAAAGNDPYIIVQLWMQSPSHRNGLLNPLWTHAGAAKGFGTTYLEVGGP